jgi:hypothetical protein
MSKKKKKRRQRPQGPAPLRSEQASPGSADSDDAERYDDVDSAVEEEWFDEEETETEDTQGALSDGGRTGTRRPGPLRAGGSSARRPRGAARTGTPRRSTRPARSAGRGRSRGPQDPQPPILAPIARSLILVGTSPLILATAFLSVLAIWLIYSSSWIIRIASPATMAQIQSLLPLHSLLDLQFMFAGLRVFSAPVAIGLSAVLLLVRAAFLSLLLALIVGVLDRRVQPATWQDELRMAGRRAYSVFQYVFAIEAGMVVAVYALSSILGAFFGALGLVMALILEMYLLVLSPVVAATERLGAGAAVRLSVRAGRLRGPQHLGLAVAYVFFALYVVLGLRGSPATPVTPSIEVWAYVLFATFVHVSLLTALTYRWLLVREVVGADQERERAPGSRRAPTR